MSESIPRHQPPSRAAIARYLIGESTPEETAVITQWMGDDPEKQAAVASLRMWWGTRLEATNHEQVESALGVAMQRVNMSGTSRPQTEESLTDGSPAISSHAVNSHTDLRVRGMPFVRRRTRPFRYAVASVAIGALLIGTGWGVGRSMFGGGASNLVTSQATTYVTGRGERLAIVLPDGSTAHLNVGTRIDIPADYLQGNRTVRLNGEALFTVNHQSNAPFSVIAGAAHARVLGTGFTVRHYDTDTAATVAVRDGKVAVGSTVLTAQQRVMVGTQGVSRVLPASMGQFDFAAGLLTLDDMRLAEAVIELSRWYDADIRLGTTTLDGRRIKGQFKTESLADLATMLEFSHDLRVVRDGRILTLYPTSHQNPKE